MTLEVTVWLIRCCFFVWSVVCSGANAGSLRIPIGGQLVYDSSSKTADLCLSPHMCPPCVLDALCQQQNMPPVTATAATTEASSTGSSPTPTASTSSSTELTSTESASTTDTSTPTEEPASSTATPTAPSSTTDYTHPSASPTTSATEATGSSASPTATVTTATTTVGGGVEIEGGVLQVGLNKHNKYRKIHNSPPLTLNSQLNSDAQSTAERIAAQGKLVHTDDSELGGQGENLAKFCATDETPEEIISKVTERWYKEVCKYDFSKPGWSHSVGHFTQLVWASTQELGLGWATRDEGGFTCYYVAGRYNPGGNIDNRFEENVMKGSFNPSYCSSKRREIKSTRKLRDFIWPKWYHLTVRNYY
ncbi:uncharacterized protein LOC144649635 isoform X2 [Oculina patagonica]